MFISYFWRLLSACKNTKNKKNIKPSLSPTTSASSRRPKPRRARRSIHRRVSGLYGADASWHRPTLIWLMARLARGNAPSWRQRKTWSSPDTTTQKPQWGWNHAISSVGKRWRWPALRKTPRNSWRRCCHVSSCCGRVPPPPWVTKATQKPQAPKPNSGPTHRVSCPSTRICLTGSVNLRISLDR